MPELGKAVYALVIDSAQFTAGLDEAEAQANQATTRIGAAFKSEEAAATQAAVGTSAAATEIGAASERAGAGAAAGAARTESAWARSSAAIQRAGATSAAWAGMIGIGAAYFAVKGGLEWLRDAQKGWMEVKNAIQITGGVAGVTAGHVSMLANKMTDVTGYTRGANLEIAQMLLRFTNIRNVGPGVAAIFDRTYKHIYDVSEATGKATNMITLALGKAIQDPAKYLGILGRSGVTFTKTQTDMIKAIEAGKATWNNQTGIYGAQLFLLAQMDKRYGGLADSLKHSFNVEMRKAKDNIERASAAILTAMMPAMVRLAHMTVNVAHFMQRHRTIVKFLILAYVGLKVAMLVTNQLMKVGTFVVKGLRFAYRLLTGSVTRATASEVMFGRAATTTAAETEGATAATVGLRGGLIALINPFTAVIAVAGLAALALLHFRKEAEKAMDAADEANSRVGNRTGEELTFYAARVKNYMADGMSRDAAKKKARADTAKHFNDPGFSSTGHGKGAKHGGKHGGHATPPGVIGSGKKGSPKTTQDILGPGWTRLDIAYQRAQRTKSTKDDRAVLEQERKYLENILAHKHLTLQQRDEIEGMLTSVDQEIKGMGGRGRHKGAGSGHSLWSPQMRIALARAQRTKSLKDDIGVYEKERRALVLQEKHTKNMKDRAAIEEEITRIDKTLAKLRKQEAADLEKKHTVTMREVQDMLNLRSTFFGQFAPDIFHTGDDGKLHLGGRGTVDVQQHNHYHEVPKDRHHEARRMKRAVEGRMA